MPTEFVAQVRHVLAHLFDAGSLHRHPLVTILVPPDVTDPSLRAQALREALLQAIADLRPPPGVAMRDPAYRPYAILRHKYADGLANEDIQDRLAISRRQFFREQQRACEALASLLWQRRLAAADGDQPGSTLGEELDQLGLRPESFALAGTVHQAILAVRALADARGVSLVEHEGPAPDAYADEAICRQVVVGLLSSLIQRHPCGHLEVRLSGDVRWAVATVEGSHLGEPETLQQHLEVPARLAAQAGGRLEVGADCGRAYVRLRLPLSRRERVLVVDDNPKTLRLFQRYLESGRYHPLLVQESTEALTRVHETQPDAIVLDVMMRDTDGWQILQTLKTDPRTRHVPVVICSVLDERELAATIGADAYLRKPVSQAEFLQALALVRRRTAATARPR